MIYAFLGLLLGILIGLTTHISFPLGYAHYTAVVILGLLDAIIGAIRSDVSDNTFDVIVFLSGLIFNAILAIAITYLGEILGLNLYLAATVVFTFRIFQNVGITRRVLLDKWIKTQEIKKNAKKASHV
jgi:small basic protein